MSGNFSKDQSFSHTSSGSSVTSSSPVTDDAVEMVREKGLQLNLTQRTSSSHKSVSSSKAPSFSLSPSVSTPPSPSMKETNETIGMSLKLKNRISSRRSSISQIFSNQLSVNSSMSTEMEGSSSQFDVEERERSHYSDDFESSSTSETYDSQKKLERSRRLGLEFESQLKNLSNLLRIITEELPSYLETKGRKLSKILVPQKQDHILLQIINKMNMIKGFHAAFTDGFDVVDFSSIQEAPQFAAVVIENADVLKSFIPFLKEKTELVEKMKLSRANDKELDLALSKFEKTNFKQGGHLNLQNQLDRIHQTIMRYGFLMDEFSKCFSDGSHMKEKAEEAVNKLKDVTTIIEAEMATATENETRKVHERLQGRFDTFKKARKLLLQERVWSDNGMKRQERYIILFTDCLLVCRLTNSKDPGSTIEKNFYEFDLNTIEIEIDHYREYEKTLKVSTTERGFFFLFENGKLKTDWIKAILDSQEKIKHRIGYNQKVVEAKKKFLKPVWILESGECLMEQCSEKFKSAEERNHCRRCGLSICSLCTGFAPVSQYLFERKIVCPDCFKEIYDDYVTGTLFPEELKHSRKGKLYVKIGKKEEVKAADKLFKEPMKRDLKKFDLEERKKETKAFGLVYLRSGAMETEAFAWLKNDDRLVFVKQKLDFKPIFERNIGNHDVRRSKERDGLVFAFSKRGMTNDDFTFRVEEPYSIKKWNIVLTDHFTETK
ncbi:hypothetical protein GCK72_022504 [Caenorhabditis remanei]|uniref:DH domain-containing protein n=1 Tax=Caenorhabditis remanei TaxID=31234 RepID=A0A6A5FU31_CAERE|nr:hypothetical protein GCK72_022504 [Caenorhabditis remanei]KAF1746053.1 hypothetical protein GCK72_022504 [Caenorhabditis remanei]